MRTWTPGAAIVAAVFVLAIQAGAGQTATEWHTSDAQATVAPATISTPVPITQNQGQWDGRVRYCAQVGDATIWFCRDGLRCQFTRLAARAAAVEGKSQSHGNHASLTASHRSELIVTDLLFDGANPEVRITGEDPLPYRCHYFFGNDPARWQTDVPSFQSIVYHDIYPGVNLSFTGHGGQLEARWTVNPGADASQIAFHWEGRTTVEETASGALRVVAPWGDVLQLSLMPVAEDVSVRTPPAAAVPALWEGNSGPMTLEYSTYLGGLGAALDLGDITGGMLAVDPAGCAYVTGITCSAQFPIQDPYDGSFDGTSDIFVTKLAASGDGLIYSTFLGGNADDHGGDIAVDASGCAYVTGYTNSTDYPLQNPYDGSPSAEGDVIVTKLSTDGAALEYSTLLGGGGTEWGSKIAVDASGWAYVTGGTGSVDFPTHDAYDPDHNGGDDVFVTKLAPSGNALGFSTFLGGSDDEWSSDLVIDAAGDVYVTGQTASSDFPTQDAFDADYNGNGDAFVAKIEATGDALAYCTFLGGSDIDEGFSISVDAAGHACVSGRTTSADFPTEAPFDGSHNGGEDGFVVKLNTTGNSLEYATFIGGTGQDGVAGIMDAAGRVYLTGFTGSMDFPTQDALDASYNGGSSDCLVARLSSTGSALEFGTFFGGSELDGALGIVVDDNGSAYVAGITGSPNLPVRNAYDATYNGDWDAFVAKVNFYCDCPNQGDYDESGFLDGVDLNALIEALFFNGVEPYDPACPTSRGDFNNDGVPDALDLNDLIDHLFFSGPQPADPCLP